MKEKRFLYPVAFRTTSQEQLTRMFDKCKEFGYATSDYGQYDTAPYIVVTSDETVLNNQNLGHNDQHPCQSEEEFLALSAMRERNGLSKGELVVCTKGYERQFSQGTIYVVRENCLDRVRVESDDEGDANGIGISYFRKATKEEIINHFRKKDGVGVQYSEPVSEFYRGEKVEVKMPSGKWVKGTIAGTVTADGYNILIDGVAGYYHMRAIRKVKEDAAPFKVGDEVEIIDGDHIGLKGEITDIDRSPNKIWPVRIFVKERNSSLLFKYSELRPISVSNSKEPFTVEGSKYLKEAFCKELIEECGFADSKNTMNTARYLIASSMTQKGITSTDLINDRHFKLPEQYIEAKQAFIDFYKEDKPTEVPVKIAYGYGKFYDLIVTKDNVFHNGNSLHIDVVKAVSERLSPLQYLSREHTFHIDISPSCTDGLNGLKGITYKDTQLILDTHTKYFG